MSCRNLIKRSLPALVLLMIVSNLPRFGCVSADGSHLPFCQKLVSTTISQLGQLFKSKKQNVCACCGGCEHESTPVPRDCSSHGGPCDCRITFEGPQWSSTDRVDAPVDLDLNGNVASLPQLQRVPSPVEIRFHRSDQQTDSSPSLTGIVRLNV